MKICFIHIPNIFCPIYSLINHESVRYHFMKILKFLFALLIYVLIHYYKELFSICLIFTIIHYSFLDQVIIIDDSTLIYGAFLASLLYIVAAHHDG